MCGITGFTHLHQKPDPNRIRRATATLHHRGPDQQGVYHSDVASLGAVRLKIIDLAGGDQPVHSPDGNTVIVFNGEIYNHDELRRELRALGHSFQSRCDTEVVLHAFLAWDTGCFTRLRGMFAVALWQDRERRLVLARDRVGIKPLYLHRRGRDLYFGSELKAILEHPEVDRRLDPVGLHFYLSLNYVPTPYTLVEGIGKLRPGHWLEWRHGVERMESYWQPAMRPESRWTLSAAKEELDSLLQQSVKEHLLADVPLGVWASGGLDSSTVLHYAAQATSTPLKTFSVSFLGRRFDESAYFREVARHYHTDHHEFDLHPGIDLSSAIEDMAYYSDEPSADAGALPVWFLSRMCRQHVTVALSGEGADEIFGGYQTYLADRYARWARLSPAPLRRLALTALQHWPVSDEKISLEYKVKRLLGGSLLDPVAAHFFWNGTFTQAEKRRLLRRPLDRSLGELGQARELNGFLLLDQHYYLPDDILYKCDRMSMAHSLEVRPPFLDHRLIEFAGRLPVSLKVRGNKLKYLLRALMQDKLPAAVLTRRKEGFDIPAHHWFRTVLRPLLLDTLSPDHIARTGLFHQKEMDSLIRRHLDRRANLGYHLWGLLTLFLWLRRWNIQTDPALRDSREPVNSAATD